MKKTIGTLCVATAIGIGGFVVAPVANAWTVGGSACVRSGQSEEYCIGRFMETVNSMPVFVNHPEWSADRAISVQNAMLAIDGMIRSFDSNAHALPPKEMYWDQVRLIKDGNPDYSDADAIGFMYASIHWFGPPGLEDAAKKLGLI
jgi:hypothetical protein